MFCEIHSQKIKLKKVLSLFWCAFRSLTQVCKVIAETPECFHRLKHILSEKLADIKEEKDIEINDEKPLNETKPQKKESLTNNKGSVKSIERVFVCRCCPLICICAAKRMAKVTKALLLFFNVILWMFGWAICGIGIWLIVDPKSYEPSRFIDTYNIVIAAYIMIVVGGIIMFLGLLGCAAAFTEVSSLLIIYGVILLILFGLQVAIITLGIFHGFGERLYNFAFRELIAELQQYPYDDRARGFIDFFQVKLRCCGVISLNDYQRYGMSIPTSCYLTGTQFLNQKGCALALREFLELRSGIIGLLCLIAALIQLVLIGLTLMLFCSKKKDYIR